MTKERESEDGRLAALNDALDELVAHITPDNRHDETNWGPPVGREVW